MSSIGRKLARQAKRDAPETPELEENGEVKPKAQAARPSSLSGPQNQRSANQPRVANRVFQRRSGNA